MKNQNQIQDDERILSDQKHILSSKRWQAIVARLEEKRIYNSVIKKTQSILESD